MGGVSDMFPLFPYVPLLGWPAFPRAPFLLSRLGVRDTCRQAGCNIPFCVNKQVATVSPTFQGLLS